MVKSKAMKVNVEISEYEQNEQVSISQHEIQSTTYDRKHRVSNQIRLETILTYTPPKNSLSELIFLNKPSELEKKLKSNVDLNQRDEEGKTFSWTPLYWGVKMGHVECVKILLNHGADINIVVNDSEECCGTVLDLATLRNDEEMEVILREYAEKEDVSLGQSFKAIRTKLRGKAPAFNFRYYGKKKETT